MTALFRTNTPISTPTDEQFNADYTMQGFAFDLEQGLFIPNDGGLDYFEDPLPHPLVQKL